MRFTPIDLNSFFTLDAEMLKKLKLFCRSEKGAVTVDWVVLTAAIVALAGVSYVAVKDSSDGLASGTGDFVGGLEAGEF